MWTDDIEAIVLSRCKHTLTPQLKNEYPDIKFTTTDRVQTKPQFPTVYIHEVGTTEQGADLDGKTINAVMATLQVDVTDDVSQNRAKNVMSAVLEVLKGMRFQVVAMPQFDNTNGSYRRTARVRRMVGSGDIL